MTSAHEVARGLHELLERLVRVDLQGEAAGGGLEGRGALAPGVELRLRLLVHACVLHAGRRLIGHGLEQVDVLLAVARAVLALAQEQHAGEVAPGDDGDVESEVRLLQGVPRRLAQRLPLGEQRDLMGEHHPLFAREASEGGTPGGEGDREREVDPGRGREAEALPAAVGLQQPHELRADGTAHELDERAGEGVGVGDVPDALAELLERPQRRVASAEEALVHPALETVLEPR